MNSRSGGGGTQLAFTVHSLASGSSGNAFLVRGGDTNILLDAGLPAIQLQKRLAKFRLNLGDLDAVFLTHEHSDHSLSANTLSRRFGIPIAANANTLSAIERRSPLDHCIPFETGTTTHVRELSVESFSVHHDAVDPVGYNVLFGKHKISLVTDTGMVEESISRSVEGTELAIVEANHDEEKLHGGPYPGSLKARVLGKMGHLSNEAAADFVVNQAEGSRRLSAVWLAHLSEVNNSPRMARRHVQKKLSEAGCRGMVLEVALRNAVSLTWRASSN